MRLELKACPAVKSEGGDRGLASQVKRSFRRFSDRILVIRARLMSLAARDGEGARECRMVLRLARGGEVVVTARGPNAGSALATAIRRARKTLTRRTDRKLGRGRSGS